MKQLGTPSGHRRRRACQPGYWQYKALYQPTLGPCSSHSEAVRGLAGTAVSWALWCQSQEAAIPSLRHTGSSVLIISLDVLLGHLELILRTPNYLTFVWSLSLQILSWHPKTPPKRGSYRCSPFAGGLFLEPAQGPGLWSPWGPSGQGRLLKARDCGRGFSHSE